MLWWWMTFSRWASISISGPSDRSHTNVQMHITYSKHDEWAEAPHLSEARLCEKSQLIIKYKRSNYSLVENKAASHR